MYPRLIYDPSTVVFRLVISRKCHRVLVSTKYNRITFQCSFIKVLRDSVVAGYDNACINNNRLTKTKRITGTRVNNRRIAWVGYIYIYNRALSHKRWEDKLGFFPTIERAYSHGFSDRAKIYFYECAKRGWSNYYSPLFLYRRIIEHSYGARSSFPFSGLATIVKQWYEQRVERQF